MKTTYEDARAYCASLGEGWLVPTRIELATLLDLTRDAGPAWNPIFDDDAGQRLLWTASRAVTAPDYHWTINFDTGVVQITSGGGVSVRCVRLP
jgi:hypothetical protein